MRVVNTQLILALVVEAGNVLDLVKKAEGMTAKAIASAKLFDEVAGLINIDIDELKAEFDEGFDEEEMAQLSKFAKEKYDIADDKVESLVEFALDVVFEISAQIKRVQHKWQELKS